MSSSLRLTPQVLAALGVFANAPHGAELYGRQISTRTGNLPGTVYPLLERLLKLGWLADRWEERGPSNAGRPLRRYYRLTEKGRADVDEVFERFREQVLERAVTVEGAAVEVRVLTRLVAVEGFEEALAAFLDSCPHVTGGYTFSVWPVEA